ncbi:MAG: hypothetical protein ACOC53_07980 [Candidatus Saliniplasma sp.]
MKKCEKCGEYFFQEHALKDLKHPEKQTIYAEHMREEHGVTKIEDFQEGES